MPQRTHSPAVHHTMLPAHSEDSKMYSAALTTAWPAANRRSHLDWTDVDMKTVGAGGAVGAGTEHTGAGGERAADTAYAHELGPHRCDAADDVGSYLVRNTLADFLGQSHKRAYSARAPTTTQASLIPPGMSPDAAARELADADAKLRAFSLALHDAFAELSRCQQERQRHSERAAALETELDAARQALNQGAAEEMRLHQAIAQADEELVRADQAARHTQQAAAARADADAQRLRDAEKQVETLMLQRAALESRLAIQSAGDNQALQEKVDSARQQAFLHMQDSIAAAQAQAEGTAKIIALQEELAAVRAELREAEERAAWQREALGPLVNGQAEAALEVVSAGRVGELLREREAALEGKEAALEQREAKALAFERALNEQVCVCVCLCLRVCTCMHTYMNVFICLCVNAHVYTCIV